MGIGNIVNGCNKADSSFAQAFCNVHTLRYGLESGPVRRASTGVSPLLSLWLPSPEVAVKSLAVRRKAFTNRTALQPSLLLLLSIGKVILLCHHIGTQPVRHTRPLACQRRLCLKRASHRAL